MSMPPTTSQGFDEALRKYATQATTALSIVIGVTGVMMFFHLAKPQVEGMHEWLGLGFVVVAALHAFRHRRVVVGMLSQTRMRVLFAATALAAIGFLVLTPPKQGNPARLAVQLVTQAPLADLSPLLHVPAEELAARLHAAGVAQVATDQSLDAIAKAQGADPMKLMAALLKAPKRQ